MCIVRCMRTNIDIDEELLAAAKAVAGTTTKRETVEVALRQLVDSSRRREILALRGKVRWEGDLQISRADRPLPEVVFEVVPEGDRDAVSQTKHRNSE